MNKLNMITYLEDELLKEIRLVQEERKKLEKKTKASEKGKRTASFE